MSGGRGKTPRFEVGNTVFAQGRVSHVEKVYANGNFVIAGIEGQWRQGGYKAGDGRGFAEHYTEDLARRIATERARGRLRGALGDLGDRRNRVSHLSLEAAEKLLSEAQAILAALEPQS